MKDESKEFRPVAGFYHGHGSRSHTITQSQMPSHRMGAERYTPIESDEMRLLKCLCDVLGYDVKATLSHSSCNANTGETVNHFSYQLVRQIDK